MREEDRIRDLFSNIPRYALFAIIEISENKNRAGLETRSKRMTQTELIKELTGCKELSERFLSEYESVPEEKLNGLTRQQATSYEFGKTVGYGHAIELLKNNEIEQEWNMIGAEEAEDEEFELQWTGDIPEEDSVVLITLTSGSIAMTSFCQEYGFDGFDYDEVIAWMPLPTPYRMGVVENENSD